MDPPPHPLSNATHVLRYHPLRCIIIIILAAVFVADDMFEVSYCTVPVSSYHQMVGIVLSNYDVHSNGMIDDGCVRRGNRCLATRWGS